MEKMSGASAKEWQNDIGIVTGVDLVIRDMVDIGRIVAELAEVAIERTILLQHHDDVLDPLQPAVRDNIYRGRSRGCVALRVRGGDGVNGILRRRNRDASAGAGNRRNSLINADGYSAR